MRHAYGAYASQAAALQRADPIAYGALYEWYSQHITSPEYVVFGIFNGLLFIAALVLDRLLGGRPVLRLILGAMVLVGTISRHAALS